MKNESNIKRIVPNIYSTDLESSKKFYIAFLDMELIMDMGWILTFASMHNPNSQLSILQFEKGAILDNGTTFLSIEVSDIDNLYRKAKKRNIEITYPITEELWGVKRFFVKDPSGATINILMHL